MGGRPRAREAVRALFRAGAGATRLSCASNDLDIAFEISGGMADMVAVFVGQSMSGVQCADIGMQLLGVVEGGRSI